MFEPVPTTAAPNKPNKNHDRQPDFSSSDVFRLSSMPSIIRAGTAMIIKQGETDAPAAARPGASKAKTKIKRQPPTAFPKPPPADGITAVTTIETIAAPIRQNAKASSGAAYLVETIQMPRGTLSTAKKTNDPMKASSFIMLPSRAGQALEITNLSSLVRHQKISRPITELDA